MTTNGIRSNKDDNGRMEIFIDYVDEIYNEGDEKIFVINGKRIREKELVKGSTEYTINIGYAESMTLNL